MSKMCAVVQCTKDSVDEVLIPAFAGAVAIVPLCRIHLENHKASGSSLDNSSVEEAHEKSS